MKHFLYSLFLFISSLSLAQTEESIPETHYRQTHAIGLTMLKSETAFGFGYRYENPNKFGFDVDFGWASKRKNLKLDQFQIHTSNSFGIEAALKYNFLTRTHFKLYAFQANSLFYDHYKPQNNSQNPVELNEYTNRHSIGLGTQFQIVERIGFNAFLKLSLQKHNSFQSGNLGTSFYYKF